MFLDLSDTLAARDAAVLSSLRFMHGLQVLKLRHVQLRDEDVDILASAIGIRVRSLDVRDNRLTDQGVRTLLSHCFHPTRDVHATQSQTAAVRADDEDWPSGMPRPDPHVMNQFRGDDMDERFVKRLTTAVGGRIPTEDLPPTGITHLYIGNNFVTVEALASLIKTQNLHVLDAGAIDTVKAIGRLGNRSSMSQAFNVRLPGVEKLTPVLEKFAAKNLTYLRLHHAIVSEGATFRDKDDFFLSELGGEESRLEMDATTPIGHELEADGTLRQELDADNPARHETEANSTLWHEMDAITPTYELSANPAPPSAELSADPVRIVISPADDIPPSSGSNEVSDLEVGRKPECGKESQEYDEGETPLIVTSNGLGNTAQAINGIRSNAKVYTTTPASGSGALSSLAAKASADVRKEIETHIDQLVSERRDLRKGQRDSNRGLLPGLLPSLRVLVLTEVPTHADSPTLVENLKSFIQDCAREHHLARAQAALEDPAPHIPTKLRSDRHQQRARSLFALQRIVLEMAHSHSFCAAAPLSHRCAYDSGPISPHSPRSPASPRSQPPTSSRYAHLSFRGQLYSSTEDPDTEALWKAAANDFSFFGDEECGLPAAEPGMHVPLSAVSEKMVLSDDEGGGGGGGGGDVDKGVLKASAASTKLGRAHPASLGGQGKEAGEGHGNEKMVDVVAELARWRAERRTAAEELGKGGGFVPGFWEGEVKVVRPEPLGKRKGAVDWYGNYFEKGVYR